MSDENFRTIEELIIRYDLEPNLRDVYVEGRRDFIFFKNFFEITNHNNVIVYQISDCIRFSERERQNAETENLKLFQNNRNKVIFLAQEIDSKLINKNPIRCITDKDFDTILRVYYHCSILYFTDYANIEMYLFNEETLNKYLETFLRKINCPIGLILEEFSKFLIRIFLIRVTNEILNFKLEWLDFSKYWSCKKLKISFKESKYINSYLSKSNMHHKKEIFFSEMKKMELAITNEPRNYIHGHDFINLLSSYNKRGLKKKHKYCDIDIIEGVLYSCFEIKTIIKEELFQKLLKWANN